MWLSLLVPQMKWEVTHTKILCGLGNLAAEDPQHTS